jgi:Mn-dependent DtxR family transcriptional regulator
MRIQESGEMYLESIYVLLKKNGNVRSVDIAEYMGYSKPSISRAMGLLKDGDFIRIAKDGSITLTRAGIAVAEKIYERHTLLSNLLIRLGVSPETAGEDACKLEHAISDESFEAIKKFVTDYENKPV